MKYKALGAVACVGVLLIGMLNWQRFWNAEKEQRYHQHLETPAKELCTISHDSGKLCTHLPLLCIDTGAQPIPGAGILDENGGYNGFTAASDGSDRITARLDMMDAAAQYNHPTDPPTLTSPMVIHVRGNSSRWFDKPGYRIELVDENGNNNPQSLLGMDAHHEWALHGPYLDKTLLRNYIWYNLAGEIMDYAPNVRFCELMLNGEYRGVYVLTELIGAGKDGARLDLSADVKDNTYTGYLLRLDRYDDSREDWLRSLTTYTYRNDPELKLEIEFPGAEKRTPALCSAIKQDFSRFEKALYSYDYDHKQYGYTRYADVDSFVDYFILNEITVNYDAGAYSTYIYKDTGGKLKMCVWDFNNACDNYQELSVMQVPHFELQNRLWFGMLMKDEGFVERILSRYRELRKTYLSEEALNRYIDDVIEYLGPAIERNFSRWGYSFEDDTLLTPAQRNLHSYEEAVGQLKGFLKMRGDWMDDNIDTLRQYCAESRVKKYNEVTD